MLLLFIAFGFAVGVVEQIMSFPITYFEYKKAVRDDIKRREFYKTAVADFLLTELFFIAIAMLAGLYFQYWN